MNQYKDYNFDQFLLDESFRCWVLKPSPEISAVWEKIMESNPHQAETIMQARTFLLTLDERFGKESFKADFENNIKSIVKAASNVESVQSFAEKQRFYNFGWIWAAASVTLLLTVGVLFFKKGKLEAETIVRRNNTKEAMTFLLGDSSMVILESGSTLAYPAEFSGSLRKVTLEGTAFFEIRRNEQKPFLVFANRTVTKVLGTSFKVSSDRLGNSVTVKVKTGKVAVFRETDEDKELPAGDKNQVLLTSDEQVVFENNKESKPGAVVAEKTRLTEVEKISTNRIYEDMPIPVILHALELEYGISITYDKKMLSGCLLNTQFNQEFLQQKLLAVCKAIGATYEITEGRINIKSNGCG